MSGPKVDIAELRHQEMKRLAEARRKRLSVADKIQNSINLISKYISPDLLKLENEPSMGLSIKKVCESKNKYVDELNNLLEQVKNGDELLDVDEKIKQCDMLFKKFKELAENELALIEKLSVSSQKFQLFEQEGQAIAQAKRKRVTHIKVENANNLQGKIIENKSVQQDFNDFNKEIDEFMDNDRLSIKHKNSILQIKQDLMNLFVSDISDERKQKRIARLYNDYEKITLLILNNIENLSNIYDEYCKECFDMQSECKDINLFSSVKEVENAILDIREKAEKRMSKQYIQRQIDEVMQKHGYDVVQSDILETSEMNGQILYGVDNDSAIDVFVSDENQVTMRVVGVGFDSNMTSDENEKLYKQQCAFCRMHPQITAELAMRGVILHTKNHLPPDKKFNKKIQTKKKSSNQTINKAKKEIKRTENKVMYKE